MSEVSTSISGPNQISGHVTILSSFSPKNAPHQEKLLFEIIKYLQSDINHSACHGNISTINIALSILIFS